MLKPFLTANWRYLAMLNFVADPKILQPLVPSETELDFHEGQTFLSVVGFLFLDARVEKKKTDHAEKCLALVEIQFRLTRHQRLQDFRIGDEIQHRQVTPVRGEKWFEHGGSSTSRSMLI